MQHLKPGAESPPGVLFSGESAENKEEAENTTDENEEAENKFSWVY